MNEQDGRQAVVHRPNTNDQDEWKAYWEEQGQPWRTEPEIDAERQKYLAEQRSITPDIKQGIYPFKDIQLCRADVEWLLATHENGRGPVDWSDKSQRERKGVDLRGAILCGANLGGLPLACMLGGLKKNELKENELLQHVSESYATDQLAMAAVHLEEANLFETHLEGAILSKGHLERANVRRAYLEKANLHYAHLEEAFLSRAHLEGAFLRLAHLEGTILYMANLEEVDLRNAFFNHATDVDRVILGNQARGFANLVDVRWGGVNLALVDWTPVKRLGDEFKARQQKWSSGSMKGETTRMDELQAAVRANRQLGVMLRGQGLNEVADRFAYRAQVLQRKVFWMQKKFGRGFFSGFLALVAGYGYRMERILFTYAIVVSLFALAYFILGMHYPPPIPLSQAFFESITAFHGRVFFEQFSLNTPQILVTAGEAIAGLVVEGVFIAMLTQRFFGR
jgi:uncharacterized protein YjbI with pentapeptide repeats